MYSYVICMYILRGKYKSVDQINLECVVWERFFVIQLIGFESQQVLSWVFQSLLCISCCVIVYLFCVILLQIGKVFCRGRNCSLKSGWFVVIKFVDRRGNIQIQVSQFGFVGEWLGFGIWELFILMEMGQKLWILRRLWLRY